MTERPDDARAHTALGVVVTGAAGGIGRATALAFADRGDDLVLAGRSRVTLEEVARGCRDRGVRAVVVPTDVSEPAQTDALVDTALAELGRVDVVVHCAAVLAYGEFGKIPSEVVDRVLKVDINGTANMARSALRRFTAQGGGRLVLFGSVLGKIAPPLMSSYVMSKWAVHGLARALQAETRSMPGVHVHLVTPGAVDTPVYQHAGNYLGHVAQAPPPVVTAEKVARAVVGLMDTPRREVSIGAANLLMELGFRHLPGLYDVLVTPLLKRLGVSSTPVAPNPGNVFEPRA
ncbi:short-chain dehydrogenase/reductase SDR [Kribbella flavida DSM 17836]|uniref:Short-chain dehydrogenase/reductase SDR n=1 Tax=Kribbella flavida (strain DSM 17836 / JCM 10339 / NBRC 14399) TaxID=479435 RepID=D2PPV3_KRIFD|nr:SDR family NAD(P)-dependent oxidoreductase [Kribbella flavida]ADB32877.1 short-chain dehydrogenase/reductase SDR [Kribbella flavida DSM 17836]